MYDVSHVFCFLLFFGMFIFYKLNNMWLVQISHGHDQGHRQFQHGQNFHHGQLQFQHGQKFHHGQSQYGHGHLDGHGGHFDNGQIQGDK